MSETPGLERPASQPSVGGRAGHLVSMRGAASILAEVGLSWKAARAVLMCGLAGPGKRAGGAVLYDRAAVEELLSRPWVRPVGIERAFVARIAAGRLQLSTRDQQDPDLAERDLPERDQAEWDQAEWDQVRHGWVTDSITRLRLRLAVEERGYVPFVATVGGYVALGADVVGVAVAGAGPTESTSLTLAAPGEWWERYAGHRLSTGRGHHWIFWPRARPGEPLTAPTREAPRATPSRRRTREQGMRADSTSLPR